MPNKLYVGNVSYRATEEDLIKKFSEFGECLSAKIVLDSFSGQSKGFAFVEMGNMKNTANDNKNKLDDLFISGLLFSGPQKIM